MVIVFISKFHRC